MRQKSDEGSSPRRPQAREPLPEEVVELTAERLRVIAEPTRISLMEALNSGEAGVQELADQIDRPHKTASHHLNLLWRAGLLSRRKEGTMTLYALTDWSAWWVVEQIARWVQTRRDQQGASSPTE
jgi:DNA-binding transcriptional ArsR family regulator